MEETLILQHKNDYTFEFTQRFTEQKKTRDKGIRIVFVYSSCTDQKPITPTEEQENLSQWEQDPELLVYRSGDVKIFL